MKNPLTRPWTPDRLMSRKFGLATVFVAVALASDLFGHPMASQTLTATRDVVVVYLGAQGLVDWRRTKNLTDFQTGASVRDSDNPGGDL
jgi:hypothetical protein